MPANSTKVLFQIEDSLRSNLGTKVDSHSLKQRLVSTSQRILQHKIAFQPALQTMSFQEQLRAKYTPLNPSSHKLHHVHSHSNGEHKEITSRDSLDGLPQPKIVIYPSEKVRLEWPKQRMQQRIGPGLHNMGNTCFLNSVLQCLAHTPPLVNYFCSEDHVAKCKIVGSCMMCEFQRHVRRCFDNPGSQNSNRIIKPLSFIHKIKMIAKHLHFGRQEDAHEFLRCLIENMARNNLVGYSKDLDRYSKETTVVNQIFGGFLRSQVVCTRCKSRSNTFDPFMDISLDIKNVQNIQRAFEKFVQVEYLDGDNAYNCAKCKQKVTAQKRFSIHTPSNVLTIQLKRFEITRFHGKITKHVAFPDKLDIRPYMSNRQGEPVMYTLYGVLVHHGSTTSSGHYFAYVKSASQSWYQMNDQMVRQSSPQAVGNQEAYLLFYVRQKASSGILQSPKCGITSPKMHQGAHSLQHTKQKAQTIGQVSHDPGMPVKRKEIGPQVYPSHNGKSSQTSANSSTSIPGLSQREKISFGIKHQASEETKPRIVMHIKHGKIAYNSAAEKAAAAGKPDAAAALSPKLQKLVPYDDNNSDSESDNKDKQSSIAGKGVDAGKNCKEERSSSGVAPSGKTLKQEPFEPVMDKKLNATTSVPGSYGQLIKDTNHRKEREGKRDDWSYAKQPSPVKRSNSVQGEDGFHSRRSYSDCGGLSVITSPDGRVNATTRGWSVLDPEAQVSPSIASESSSITSVNSTTEWQVIDKHLPQALVLPEAQHAGWTVTPSKASCSPKRDKSGDSLQITLKKTSPYSSKENSPKDRKKLGEYITNGGGDRLTSASDSYYDQEPVKKSSLSLFGACLRHDEPSSSPYQAESRSSDSGFCSADRSLSGNNGDGAQESSPLLNGLSESFSSEKHRKGKKHKKNKKKHKKKKHRDVDEKDEEHKKKKKHKKYKREDEEPLLSSDTNSPPNTTKRRLSSEDDCTKKKQKIQSEQYEWVERTYETISKSTETPTKEVPVHQWDHHVRDDHKRASGDEKREDKPRPSWDGSRHNNKNTVKELLKSSHMFGSKVQSWDGGSNTFDAERDKNKTFSMKSWEEEYEEDIDRGKVKKIKSASQQQYNHGNQFQNMQNSKNSDTERRKSGLLSPNDSSSRSSSVTSSRSDRSSHHYSHNKPYSGGGGHHHGAHHAHGYHGYSHHSGDHQGKYHDKHH